MEYVAIDFETANTAPDSACSVGLVRFDEEGRVVDSYTSLIRPPVLYFDPVCVAVHGLNASDCRWERRFDEVLKDMVPFIGDDPLVAHNAAFDMRVLRSSAAAYGVQLPNWEYYCTLALSRRMLPGRSHKLGELVCNYLETVYDAHVASSDAEMCGRLFGRLLAGKLYDKATLDHELRLRGVAYPKRLYPEGGSGLL